MKKRFPKLFQIPLLCVFLLFVLSTAFTMPAVAIGWDGVSVASSFGGGSGSEADPYLITNAEELAYLAATVNNNMNNYQDAYFKLTSDISLGGNSWTPIGIGVASRFMGNFDGDGHTITSFSCNTTGDYAGLFGYVAGAAIKNLKISGIECIGALYVGVFAGYSEYGTQFINCISDVNTVQGEQAGGILGRTGVGPGTLILGCVNYSNIQVNGLSKYAFAAGIASALGGGTIAYCANYGDIGGEAKTYVSAGGIVGMQGGDNMPATVTYCFNSGNISANAGDTTYVAAGGIVGRANHITFGEIYNCASTGTYMANKEGHSGSIIGYNKDAGVIENCYADSSPFFGQDPKGVLQGDEVTILSASDIRGTAALTNMNLDPNLFTAVPDGLPELNISAIIEDYFKSDTPVETTSPGGDTTTEPEVTTKSPDDSTSETGDSTTPPATAESKPEDTTKPGASGGCRSSVALSAVLVMIFAAVLLLRKEHFGRV